MKLYHGSSNTFDSFEIDIKHVNGDINNLVEGQGIYLTENREIAEGYGQYIYIVEVNNNKIMDFTDENVILTLLTDLGNKVNINFEDYFDIYDIVDGIISGDLSITKLYREIQLQLDANESFYNDFEENIESIESIEEQIENEYYNLLNDVIKYNDKSLGVIYICIKNEDDLKILDIIDTEEDNNTEAKVKRLIRKCN